MGLLKLPALCFGFMFPGVCKADLGIKQKENNTEMDEPNHREWTQSAEDIPVSQILEDVGQNKFSNVSEVG